MADQVIEREALDDIAARIDVIARDLALCDQPNFAEREQARRVLVEEIIVRLDRWIDVADKGRKKKLRAVKRQAHSAKDRLDQANAQFFAVIRDHLQRGLYPPTAFLEMLAFYEERGFVERWDDPPRYDNLDTLIDGILEIAELPRAQRQPEPDMVLYQPTPARIVLDLIRRLQLTAADVFYDLGSGLGRVTLMAGLMSNARVKGVEFEPAYVAFARQRADMLRLQRADFINMDARRVDYADGSVFYLYTPFKGAILHAVLDRLRHEARQRQIRICTYGPGTLEVQDPTWLRSIDDWEPNIDRPTIYRSR